MIEESMAERIRRLRKANSLTLEELATRIGVKKAAIQKYENGSVQNIPRAKIEKMAAIFEVRPSYLLCLDDAKYSSPCDNCYYCDEDIRDVAEFMVENPDYRMLFKTSKNLRKEDVWLVQSIVDRLTVKENSDHKG